MFIDVHRSGKAGGFGFLGYDLENPDGDAWDGGSELPLYIWAQQERPLETMPDPSTVTSVSVHRYEPPVGILAEVIDARGQLITSSAVADSRAVFTEDVYSPDALLELSPDELLLQPGNGHLWRRALPVELPSEAGRYGLRLRVFDRDAENVRIFGTSVRFFDRDPDAERPRIIRRGPLGLFPTRALWLTTIEVAERERVETVPDIEHALGVTLGNVAEIIGYDGPRSEDRSKAIDLNATDSVSTTLYWRAGSAASAEGGLPAYHVTVPLLPADPETGEAAGAPVAQHDGSPAAGQRPTGGWREGEIIVDPHEIALPPDLPAGHYMLIAALYDPGQERPRPIAQQDGTERDHVLLGHLELKR